MTAAALDSRSLLEGRIRALTGFLRAHRPLWEERPFTDVPPAWAEGWDPALGGFLERLDDATIDRLDAAACPGRDLPDPLGQVAREAAALVSVPRAQGPAVAAVGPRAAMYVPGRKLAQVEAFAGVAGADLSGRCAGLVDWCAGKGHLGRWLSLATGLEVTLVELDAGFATDAEGLAARAGARVRFVAADALDEAAWAVLTADRVAVALHACGGLGDALLREGAARGVARLVVAPCCYHKHQAALVDVQRGPSGERASALPPRSQAGRACALALGHGALRLATADEVVAPGRHRRARRRENAWRLGLDLLLREASGVDAYTPLGIVPKAERDLAFGAFCERVAARLGLALPARWDAGAAERSGWERARRARAWGVARGVFRRPLELWLVLDRALALCEAGRTAAVETFCDVAVSPRNLLIRSDSRPTVRAVRA